MSKLLKLSFVLLSTIALGAAENPWIGTWKLDAAKSRLMPYPKAIKEMTVTTREIGNRNVENIFNGTAVDGTPIVRKNRVSLDGGATTFLEGGPPAGVSENTTVINDKVRESTLSRDGKKLSVNHIEISEDGKTLTATVKGVNFEGKPLDTMGVYEKQ